MSRLSNCDRSNTQPPHQQNQNATVASRPPQVTPIQPTSQTVGSSRLLQTSGVSSNILNQIVNTSGNVDNSRISANLPFINNSSSNNIYFTNTVSTPPSLITTPNANIANYNASASLTPTSHLNPATSPVAKKRLKLDGSVLGLSVTNSGTQEDFFALKKRILDHKYLKLKSLKDK